MPEIVFATPHYSPPNFKGGIATYIYYFSRFLESQGHNTRVVTLRQQGKSDNASANHIVYLKNIKLPVLINFYFSWKLDRITSADDVINLNYSPFGVLLGKRKNIITTIHTLVLDEGNELSRGKSFKQQMMVLSKRTIGRMIEKRVLKKSRKIICLNDDIYKKICNVYKISPDKVNIVPNGIDLHRFGYREPRQFSANTPVKFLYVGRLVFRKNLMTFLQALESLQDRKFVFSIVGMGDQENALRDYVSKNFKPGKVNFLGYKSGEELLKSLYESDVYVLPSFYEGMPLSLLEAQSCGLPAIVGNFSNADSIIRDGENGFVAQQNTIESFRTIVSEVLDRKSSLPSMSEKSRLRMEKHFNLKNVHAETLKIFLDNGKMILPKLETI